MQHGFDPGTYGAAGKRATTRPLRFAILLMKEFTVKRRLHFGEQTKRSNDNITKKYAT